MNFYSGGLAELVSHPTPLTYSFFAHWFTGATSFGQAMGLLHLPCQKITQPILELVDDQLLISLDTEEKTLYSQTVFSYAPQKDLNAEPVLKTNLKKFLSPTCLLGTFKHITTQSGWIAQPKNVISVAQDLVDTIPHFDHQGDVSAIDQILTNEVWPNVIAIGFLAEFFHRYLTKDQSSTDLFWNQISSQVAKRDWFFKSLAAQSLVKKKEMTLEKYFEEYGLRADNDYELNSPRWQEIPAFIEERITLTHFRSDSLPVIPDLPNPSPAISALIELQIMRSEARKKTLFYINKLRQAIIAQAGSEETISELTRAALLGDDKITPDSVSSTIPIVSPRPVKSVPGGKGLPISPGEVEGQAKLITSTTSNIPQGVIGIFPNATPEFTMQYPQCAGIVFLAGGQTSHGAIVAREFGIPAVLDQNAAMIPNGSRISINGTQGSWKIL